MEVDGERAGWDASEALADDEEERQWLLERARQAAAEEERRERELLDERHGQPIVGIAHRLRVSPQAAGRAVRLLVDHGLATTSTSPMDARAKLVAPTDEGEQLLLDLRRSLFVAVCLVDDDLREGRLVALADELAALAMLEPLGQ